MAKRITSTTMPNPSMASLLRRKRTQASYHRLRACPSAEVPTPITGAYSIASTPTKPMLVSFISDARIKQSVREINQDVGEHEDQGHEEYGAAQDRKIPVGDGLD